MEKFSCPENETYVGPPPPRDKFMEKCEGDNVIEKLSCPENETCMTPPPPITTSWNS